MCNPSSGSKALAAGSADFSKQMMSQAQTVFGNDSAVFNQMKTANDATIVNGPSQHGWSVAERNERNSATITNDANAARFAGGDVRNAQAAFGGGNEVTSAGITNEQNLFTAQKSAETTARDLNENAVADWEQGRKNFLDAEGMSLDSTKVFGNMPGMDEAATKGSEQAMKDQSNLDAQSNWGRNALLSIGEAGLGMASQGLMSGGIWNKKKSGDSSSNSGTGAG
jgi:hypothetical protein